MFVLRVVRVIVDGAQRVRKDCRGFLEGDPCWRRLLAAFLASHSKTSPLIARGR